MRYASFVCSDGKCVFGAADRDGTMLSDLSTPEVSTLRSALEIWGMDGLRERAMSARTAIPADAVRWLPPIPEPRKILCIGLNYGAHVQESSRERPLHPSVFVRFADSFVGHGEATVRPFASEKFDYEAELAVVIGRPARHVREEEAMHSVAGFTCLAENSVRDYQKHAAQATPGKNFHRSGAFGPWLVDARSVGDPTRLEVIGRLNGERVQHDSVSHLIFSIPKLIAYLSTFTPLLPGDVIATGTPSGVGTSRKPPLYLRAGDVFEVEIPGVGCLRNPVADEPSS